MNNKTLSFNFELKNLSAKEFEGYGSIFNNVDAGGDIVARGAFSRSLARHKANGTLPLLLWMHNPTQVAGAWKDMKEDSKGLRVKGELADTQLGNELRTLLKMKALRGLSIGYRTLDFDFDRDGNRLIKEADLTEVSIVSLGMNPLATVSQTKSRLSDSGEYCPTIREFEQTLRDAGYSRKVAATISSRVFDNSMDRGILDSVEQRDVVDFENEDEKTLDAIRQLNEKFQIASLKSTINRGKTYEFTQRNQRSR